MTIQEFCKVLERETNERVAEQFPILQKNAIASGKRGYVEVGYDTGRRFWKVWEDYGSRELPQRTVRYFVERSTGIIFGASGWKAYNPNHEFGTLATVHEWQWDRHHARHREGKESLVPPVMRR